MTKTTKIQPSYDGTEIAVIGMHGIFPGANDLDAFWDNLADGKESIDIKGINNTATKGNGAHINAVAMPQDYACFDAPFFGFTPKDAKLMDPQHRVFLECAQAAFENAGYIPDNFSGSIGVYAGCSTNTYLLFNLLSNPELLAQIDPIQIDAANGSDYLATKVAYLLNARGPAFTIQSACSTSLVAIHTACQSLLNYDCDMALAGGVSIDPQQAKGYEYLEGGIRSPDGHCRAFDKAAQGTVMGSGAGTIVLRRLDDALKDNDHIWAVVRGSACNNDGATKVGYSAPSIEGQSSVIGEALAVANCHAESISYVEAHGTGTNLGDPVEVRALTKAFNTSKKQYCRIGTVKSNIGHLAGAAGVSGLIKTVLALKYKTIPASLHYSEPNPKIDFANSPFIVNDKTIPWATGVEPRRAGVSSFGLGGTNAHLILEEAPERPESEEPEARPRLFILSGRTETALSQAADRLANFCKKNQSPRLDDIQFTLQLGRKAFPQRECFVATDTAELLDILQTADHVDRFGRYCKHRERPVYFLFPGYGSQYSGMAYGLYRRYPVFAECIDYCIEILKTQHNINYADILFPPGNISSNSEALTSDAPIHAVHHAQMAMFILDYAVAKLMQSWGIQPQAMLGHSTGEYVAACIAGVFSLEDAVKLLAVRGDLMKKLLPPGRMMTVHMAAENVQALLNEDISIASINTPTMTVVSGSVAAVETLQSELEQRQVEYRVLNAPHAYHSHRMQAVLTPFKQYMQSVKLSAPTIPYISNVTGTWITADQAQSPDYWTQHIHSTVQFSDGIKLLMENQLPVFLEVGPGHSLSNMVRGHLSKGQVVNIVSTVRTPRKIVADDAFILRSLGELWLSGVDIDWEALNLNTNGKKIPLPSYAFERKKYWVEANTANSQNSQPADGDWNDVSGSSDTLPASNTMESDRPELSTRYLVPKSSLEKKIAAIWGKVFGIESIGVRDNFYELGGHSMLMPQLYRHYQDTFSIDLPLKTLFENETIAETATAIQIEIDKSNSSETKIFEKVTTAFPTKKLGILEEYLLEKISASFPNQDIVTEDLSSLDLSSVAMDWVLAFRKDFEIQIYIHEIPRWKTVRDGAELILSALERNTSLTSLVNEGRTDEYSEKIGPQYYMEYRQAAPSKKNPKPMVFLHSAPRSGSTLLRSMLAGHSQLFCPPELNLLYFPTMQAWKKHIGLGNQFEWTAQGLHWALVELMQLRSEEGWSLIKGYVDKNRTTQEVYAQLQTLVKDRILVDKTPPYALQMETLDHAEQMFDNAKYIILTRHPYAVIESFLRLRLDKFFEQSLFNESDVNPFIVAETVWYKSYKNLLDFKEKISADKVIVITYEDYVARPDKTMMNICEFLDLPFEKSLLTPYDGNKQRMMGGLGDPNILQHKGIEAALGETWKNINLPHTLRKETVDLAQQLGYKLPEESQPIGQPSEDALSNLPQEMLDTLYQQALDED